MRAVIAILALAATCACAPRAPKDVCGTAFCLSFGPAQNLTGIGAGQGVELRDGLVWVYGDSATGVARAFVMDSSGTLTPAGPSVKLTAGGADVISHPTGFTAREPFGTFMGKTTGGKGEIFRLDWARATAAGTLDGAILHRITDGAAENGSRPEFVRSGDSWLLATADYGDVDPHLRLYDPIAVSSAADTAHTHVVVASFPSTGFVQALHYWESRDVLILVQNRRAGRGWRLTLVALGPSIQAGALQVLDVIEPDLSGELEGFTFVDETRAVMITSSRIRNAYAVTLTDK